MEFNKYQELAGRTRNQNGYYEELANYALGMVCEAGEAGDVLKKHIFHYHILDEHDLRKELGDVLWYIANICNILEIPMSEIAELNISKLEARYPGGFNADKSINRID